MMTIINPNELFPTIDFTDGERFVPMHSNYIQLDRPVEQDIYLRAHGQFIIYKRQGQAFNTPDKKQLEVSGNNIVYILAKSDGDIRKFYENNLGNIIENKSISSEEKASVLYKCAVGIARDIFEKPDAKETVGRSQVVVENTIQLLAQSSDAFIQMISLSGHDYYTYTHCVNVLTFTVTLLSEMGFKDPKFLKEAGMGALLHDVGKSKVPIEILNKPGKLTEDEWQIMKQHPEFGAEIVEKGKMPERGVDIIVQHHERMNGKGYPQGLIGGAIPIASQAVAITDAYDAMTTNRCYQKAMSGFRALQIITQEMSGHYNPKLVEAFIRILNHKKDK
ncbi:MAG: hypothetical protein COV44_06980 [Deltaproteobacteria bacterium CG11_big_fil_rev_8_21_14_0_20_45_16]|nr:MAG: hypothetical protein COV44_06980 [Deltaproteobacteria bacterium CG11_big_fil_rev_8_21_14_0_20_45_16]